MGHQVTDIKTLLDIENALVVKVKHLTPGKLMMDIRSDGPHSVRVTGQSSTDFVVGITPKYLVTANGTVHELLTGIKFISVNKGVDLFRKCFRVIKFGALAYLVL